MGYPTKVQLIKRAASEQWYINFPAAVARAMDFTKGETVEWHISDKGRLRLVRTEAPSGSLSREKKPRTRSAKPSPNS